MPRAALGGVRVLELCEMVSGPYCGRIVADMGADVVKVEQPHAGDRSRRYGPFPGDSPHHDTSGLFLTVNLNKRGVTLNVTAPTGRAIFLDLARRADIVLVDRQPMDLRKLGLTPEAMRAVNPALIVTTITPFGWTGPYADYKAYPLNTFHAGGEGYFLPGGAWADRPPVHGGGGFAGEYDAGLAASIATVAALYARDHTGQGQHVDISRQEANMALNGLDLTKWQNMGQAESRADRGPRLGSTLRCKDGYMEINVSYNHHWEALVRAMGNPEWALNEKFKSSNGRAANDKELRANFEAWAARLTRREVTERAQDAGCPAGSVNDAAEVLSSPQMAARGFFAEVAHPLAGLHRYPSAPWKMSATPVRIERPAPRLGEHNAEVYCAELGLTPAELSDMRRAGII